MSIWYFAQYVQRFFSPVLGDPALLVNLRRLISLPDLFPPAPANCPWVADDGFFFTLDN